jgi:hypothetical protein
MSFTYKNLNKKCISLQVQKSNKKNYKERTSLYSLLSGSLTIETAIALPLFLLVIVAISYFMVILNIHLRLQLKIEEAAGKIAKQEYLTDDLTGYSFFTLRQDIMSDGFDKYLDRTFIEDGAAGISLLQSSVDSKNGIFDVVVNYNIQIPLIPDNQISIPFIQRCRFKTWVGSEIKNEDSIGGNIVYVTETGSVYHTDRNCSHLKLSIRKVLYSSLNNLRNSNGGIYHQCDVCDDYISTYPDYVYITDDGDRWHKSIECSSLKRTIYEIDITQVGTRGLCERCGGKQ